MPENNILLLNSKNSNGVITTFIRTLAKNLANQKKRSNGVAPGRIYPASFTKEETLAMQFPESIPIFVEPGCC